MDKITPNMNSPTEENKFQKPLPKMYSEQKQIILNGKKLFATDGTIYKNAVDNVATKSHILDSETLKQHNSGKVHRPAPAVLANNNKLVENQSPNRQNDNIKRIIINASERSVPNAKLLFNTSSITDGSTKLKQFAGNMDLKNKPIKIGNITIEMANKRPPKSEETHNSSDDGNMNSSLNLKCNKPMPTLLDFRAKPPAVSGNCQTFVTKNVNKKIIFRERKKEINKEEFSTGSVRRDTLKLIVKGNDTKETVQVQGEVKRIMSEGKETHTIMEGNRPPEDSNETKVEAPNDTEIEFEENKPLPDAMECASTVSNGETTPQSRNQDENGTTDTGQVVKSLRQPSFEIKNGILSDPNGYVGFVGVEPVPVETHDRKSDKETISLPPLLDQKIKEICENPTNVQVPPNLSPVKRSRSFSDCEKRIFVRPSNAKRSRKRFRRYSTTANCANKNNSDVSQSQSVERVSEDDENNEDLVYFEIDANGDVNDDEKVEEPEVDTDRVTGEIINQLEWNGDIGNLAGTGLQFGMNKFGFIEIIQDPPVSVKQETMDSDSDLYSCINCNNRGTAKMFFAPDFCSKDCFMQHTTRPKKVIPSKSKILANKSRSLLKKPVYLQPKSANKNKVESTSTSSSDDEPAPTPRRSLLNSLKKKTTSETTEDLNAPPSLFRNAFPEADNQFEIGMKLEAIDPMNQSMFCVCTVIAKQGYRINLHIDGYSSDYGFWVYANSIDIFPPGWCSETERQDRLQTPPCINNFHWPKYLTTARGCEAAPRDLFHFINERTPNNYMQKGMKLEANNLKCSGKLCVASVKDVLGSRILVNFDGYDDNNDLWFDVSSPYIHPIKTSVRQNIDLSPPPNWGTLSNFPFVWSLYLKITKSISAPFSFFYQRKPVKFLKNMRLEVVDKKLPQLIRRARIIEVKSFKLKILFEGWPEDYAYWVEDDSPDIHPIGWCQATKHPIEITTKVNPMPPCGIPVCKKLGNVLDSSQKTHSTEEECPYSSINWAAKSNLKPRTEISEQMANNSKNLLKRKQNLSTTKTTSSIEVSPKVLKTDETTVKQQLDIAKPIISDYGPSNEKMIHQIWTGNTAKAIKMSVTNGMKKNPLFWNVDEVVEYIQNIPQCANIAHLFREHEIDGEALLSITQKDLREELHILLGPAIKIYNQIVVLREEVNSEHILEIY